MLYDDILDGVLEEEGLGKATKKSSIQLASSDEKISKKEKEQVDYIQSLKPIARELWRSYQSQNVYIDYSSKEIQNCYLLRYFIPYSNLLKQELDKLKIHENINAFGGNNRISNIDNFHASFFGCGPAPEALGLLEHLASCMSPSIENLSLNLFDINSSTWSHSISLIKKYVIDKKSKKTNIKAAEADFSSSKFWTESKSKKIKKSSLVVFQNCLNEINDSSKRDLVIENIGCVLFSMPKNSIIIFIDQPTNKYSSSTDYILETIEAKAKEKNSTLKVLQTRKNNQFNCRSINGEMPGLISNFLFYTGYNPSSEADCLMLRVNLEYSSLIIQRQ